MVPHGSITQMVWINSTQSVYHITTCGCVDLKCRVVGRGLIFSSEWI